MLTADEKTHLIDTLTNARIVIQSNPYRDAVSVSLAHLAGEVWSCDGTIYWEVYGRAGLSGKQEVPQTQPGASERLEKYCIAALSDALRRHADRLIAEWSA